MHGGVNENNEIEGRWHAISLVTETCEEIIVEGDLKGLRFHGCVASAGLSPVIKRVFQEKLFGSLVPSPTQEGWDNPGEDQLQMQEPTKQSPLGPQLSNLLLRDRERESGNDFWAYIFGGTTAALEPTNDLWRVEANAGTLKVMKVVAAGMAPQARYGHGMCHLTYLRALAIYGGIGRKNEEEVFFNDLNLFFMSNSTWVKIKTDPKIEGRAFMGVGEFGSGGVMIFGGTSSKNFIDAGLNIFKLTDRTHSYLANYPGDGSGTEIFLKNFGETIAVAD